MAAGHRDTFKCVDVYTVKLVARVFKIIIGQDNGAAAAINNGDIFRREVEGDKYHAVTVSFAQVLEHFQFCLQFTLRGAQQRQIAVPFQHLADTLDHPEIEGIVDIRNAEQNLIGDVAFQ